MVSPSSSPERRLNLAIASTGREAKYVQCFRPLVFLRAPFAANGLPSPLPSACRLAKAFEDAWIEALRCRVFFCRPQNFLQRNKAKSGRFAQDLKPSPGGKIECLPETDGVLDLLSAALGRSGVSSAFGDAEEEVHATVALLGLEEHPILRQRGGSAADSCLSSCYFEGVLNSLAKTIVPFFVEFSRICFTGP
jgi:hypothetical protein